MASPAMAGRWWVWMSMGYEVNMAGMEMNRSKRRFWLRYRVIARTSPRVAAKEATDGQIESLEGAMFL